MDYPRRGLAPSRTGSKNFSPLDNVAELTKLSSSALTDYDCKQEKTPILPKSSPSQRYLNSCSPFKEEENQISEDGKPHATPSNVSPMPTFEPSTWESPLETTALTTGKDRRKRLKDGPIRARSERRSSSHTDPRVHFRRAQSNCERNTRSDFQHLSQTREWERSMVDVMPGLSLPLAGSKESIDAYERQQVVNTLCMFCQNRLICINEASMVLCPFCKSFSLVESYKAEEGEPQLLGIGMTHDLLVQEFQSS